MGQLFSKLSAKKAHAKIEKELRKEMKEGKSTKNEVKILLLGSGESGKSTVLKQMRILYGADWSAAERILFKIPILNNLINSAQTLIKAMEKLEIPWESEQTKNVAMKFLASKALIGEGEDISPECAGALKALWNDSGIQACYSRSREYQLMDSYMERVDQLSNPKYIPDNQDILRSRVMTTTIVEHRYIVGQKILKIFDVGGQRSQRKKWAPYFDDCKAIIFIAALSAYDQTCFEDEKTNRMIESLNLFESICNHSLFKDTSMILFLNKIDLFREKIKTVPVSKYFPDYTGPDNFENAGKFFSKKFRSLNKNESKTIYAHFTWATDTQQIQTVLAMVNDIVLTQNLNSVGLI
ncbi:guanine nucleotide-binding protein subunit alpha [Nowakowskiella sp. JEL0407]|nr:guanine nucleotide-binding protein subunit alpha [Nowakowskiella sp. JEL0407]